MSIVFVTVGSTSFDKLVDKVIEDNTLSVLRQLGYTKVIVQYGRGNPREPLYPGLGLFDDAAAECSLLATESRGTASVSPCTHSSRHCTMTWQQLT